MNWRSSSFNIIARMYIALSQTRDTIKLEDFRVTVNNWVLFDAAPAELLEAK